VRFASVGWVCCSVAHNASATPASEGNEL
jgi:hypothetical protein